MGAIEIAGSILSRAQERVEMSAHNIANMTTPGYKALRQFSNMLVPGAPDVSGAPSVDFTAGKLQQTGNPLDLALSGRGFFVVRSANATFYTRDGQFIRDAQGRLTTSGGAVLQLANGDAVVETATPTVLSDGTVLDSGQPAGRLEIADFSDPQQLRTDGNGLFSAPDGASANDVTTPQVRQGMLEASNVSMADEMLSIMSAMRGAESGQKVAQTYDDLMGRAISVFGQT
jgi:flagellar basal-body rod protein FlgG